MYETADQAAVARTIKNRGTDEINLATTDNHLAIVVTVDSVRAAFTADEVRFLAEEIEVVAEEDWERNVDDLLEYIHDLADIADCEKGVEEVEEKWAERGRQEEA